MSEQQEQPQSTTYTPEQQVMVLYQMTRNSPLTANQHELAKGIAENLIQWVRAMQIPPEPEPEPAEAEG